MIFNLDRLRIGHGYDAHRLAPERKLILGGVHIPYHLGLSGHSDADVLAHAVTDALLGAAGLGDIGMHFPDSAKIYEGADSLALLSETRQKILPLCTIINIDCTIILEAPKLSPYKYQMQTNLAKALAADPAQINVKAKTEEGMGFTGARQGISAHACALLLL